MNESSREFECTYVVRAAPMIQKNHQNCVDITYEHAREVVTPLLA